MNEANLESEFNAGFKFNSAFDLPSIDNSKALSNELIRVNINSEDGKRINDLLSTRYQSNYNERGVAEKRILEGEYSFSWIAQYLYETQETLDTVSLSVYSSMMNYPSSGSYTFESFVFRKSDGKLLNNEEVAEIAGTSMELIEQSIRTEFAQNQIDYYGTNTQRNLVEAISEAQKENLDELYFRIQQNNGLIITDTDVYVVLELYLGLSGAFESPIVYKIALDSIRK